jgi:hypothetical protein
LRRDPARARQEAFALTAIFAGSFLVWGLSMWVLKKNLKGPVLQIVMDTARQHAIGPWVKRAKEQPISYEAVVSSGPLAGRPVLWIVVGIGDSGALYEGDPKRPIEWTNPLDARTDPLQQSGRPYQVVAVIEKGGARPKLRHLGGVAAALIER